MNRSALKREREEPKPAPTSKKQRTSQVKSEEQEEDEAELLRCLDTWPSAPIRVRDGNAREEEAADILQWKIIDNDGSRETLRLLAQMKNVVSVQLPKMPKPYITRLVFDPQHKSLVAIKNEMVIGGITFRPFSKEGMPKIVEVVFCVITRPEQRGGYGSRLMNQLKAWSQKNSYPHLLTYADDTALGYFQRQGFSCTIGMETKEWDFGFLKFYDSATLMHCKVESNIDYLTITHSLRLQRCRYIKKLHELCNQHSIYPGIKMENGQNRLDLNSVPGLRDCGWDSQAYDRLVSKESQDKITAENRRLWKPSRTTRFSPMPFPNPLSSYIPTLQKSTCSGSPILSI